MDFIYNFGILKIDKRDSIIAATKAACGGGDNNKQSMRKLSSGSLGRSLLTMSSISAGGTLKSPESIESLLNSGNDQISRKDRKRKRTELEGKGKLKMKTLVKLIVLKS